MRLKTVLYVCALLALALAAAACGKGDEKATKDFDEGGGEEQVKKGVKPEPDAQAAVIETDYGRIVVELYPNLAPQMVERFKTLANQKFYDGTAIHRINPELGIIQGGDPNSKDDEPGNDGAGSSGLPDVPAEFSDVRFERGILGAARTGADINSANCQFFIVTARSQPAFEQPGNRYTVFGKVIEGMNNADIISTAPVADDMPERPAVRIGVRSVTLAPRSNFK